MSDSERAFIFELESRLTKPSDFPFSEHMMPAAVLVPIVFRGAIPHLIFTLRTMTVAHHKGQISFPGGAFESGDAGPVETALREAWEEIGLFPKLVQPIGCMAPVPTISSFLVTPVVGVVDKGADLARNPDEVAEVFELPLPAFFNPAHHTTRPYAHRGKVYTVHHFEIMERQVWGVTGEIVYRLTALLAPICLKLGADGMIPNCSKRLSID